jgi:hypothetical protein
MMGDKFTENGLGAAETTANEKKSKIMMGYVCPFHLSLFLTYAQDTPLRLKRSEGLGAGK